MASCGSRMPPRSACAAPRPAPDRPPILSPLQALPCQIRVAASAPPTGTSRAGWRRRSRRCRAPSRAPARTGPGRRRRRPPSEALGSNPIEPVSIAASSLRMSPNMFSVRITSKCRGAEISCIAALSTSRCSSSIVRELAAVDVAHDLPPQTAGLEHVGLVDARHARARRPERDPRDPLDLLARVHAGVRRRVVGTGLLAEVDPSGQLADHHQVGALDQLALQRARVIQRRDRPHGPQVREQPEPLAQAQQALLGPGLGRVGRVPFRTSDGGEQHGVRPAARLERFVRQRRPVGVDRRSAYQVLLVIELGPGRRPAPRRPAR